MPANEPQPRLWVMNPARAGLVGWLLRYLAFLLLTLATVSVAGAVVVYRQYAAAIPSVGEVEQYQSTAPGVTRIYAADATLLRELAREHRAYVPIEDVPEPLIQAFLAAEDRRFYEHGGLDWRGLGRALVANLRSGTVVQGGSTITQQVAKGFLSQDRTLDRKLKEALLSLRIEARLGKPRILEIYLNKIFLGTGVYGVGAAASRYFDKPLSELTLAECALLAGLARAPSRYNPVTSLERATARRAVVLQDMVEAGFIDAAARDAANAEPIRLASAPDVFLLREPGYAEQVRLEVAARLGADAVLEDGLQIETAVERPLQAAGRRTIDEGLRELDRRQGWRGPEATLASARARTTFLERATARYGADPWPGWDPETGDHAALPWHLALVLEVERREAVVQVGGLEGRIPLAQLSWAAPYDKATGVNGAVIEDARDALIVGDVVWVRPAAAARTDREREARAADPRPVLQLGQTPRNEAALYTIDLDTGYVVGMLGARDYDASQFNRAVAACRQPGSVFKAIYYAYAIDTGEWTMASMLEDQPYEPEPGEEWDPKNIHGTLEGEVLLRTAFIRSLNLPSIRLFQRLGADAVVEWARRLGFTTELIADKALSLGASCVRMDELTAALATFARGGTRPPRVFATRVIDKRGVVRIDDRHPYDGGLDVAGRIDAIARLALAPPVQVVDERTAFIATKLMVDVVQAGIGARARKVGVPAGGKSGTASKGANTTDTWFVGFTSRFATGAWMGDDSYERSMGDEEASYTTATPLWTDYMLEVVRDVPHDKLPRSRPAGISTKIVDARTGEEPTAGQPSAALYFSGAPPS
jgi:penicillin-binding protein 1A